MDTAPQKVTCTERVRMNAIAGFLFVAIGDAILLFAILGNTAGTIGAVITGVCGAAAVFFGLFYMCCYMNKRITVSEDGVDYTNWMGRKSHYGWNKVIATHRPGRNARFYFLLNGRKASFYGYSVNALALHEFLLNHEKYDNDTLRAEREALKAEEERARQMKREAQSDASDWDDDDDEDWD